MVKHMVLWKIDDKFTPEEKKAHKEKMKSSLEALKDVVQGIHCLKVITEVLPSSSEDADIVLDSTFENIEALNEYQKHPKHLEAGSFIRSVTVKRICIDYND